MEKDNTFAFTLFKSHLEKKSVSQQQKHILICFSMQLIISGLQMCDEKWIPTNLWISMWGVTPEKFI